MLEPIHLKPTNIYLMFSKYPNVKVYLPGTILLLYRNEKRASVHRQRLTMAFTLMTTFNTQPATVSSLYVESQWHSIQMETFNIDTYRNNDRYTKYLELTCTGEKYDGVIERSQMPDILHVNIEIGKI